VAVQDGVSGFADTDEARSRPLPPAGRCSGPDRGQWAGVELPGAFPAVASSLSSIRRGVAACAQRAGAPAPQVAAMVSAVNEAAANAVVHAYDGGAEDARVWVGYELDAGWLHFTVADRGGGLRPRRSSPGLGLGFAIIAQLADELELRDAEGGGVEIRMGFRLSG